MARKIPFLDARKKLVDKKDSQLQKTLQSFQEGLVDALYLFAASRLATNDGQILSTPENLTVMSDLDRAFQQYMGGQAGNNLVNGIIQDIDDISDVNEKYYNAQTSDSSFPEFFSEAKNYMYTYLGIEIGQRVLREGSQLYDTLFSNDWLKYLKASIIDAIENNGTLRSLRNTFKKVGGDRYFKQVKEAIPNLYYRSESLLAKKTATRLEMDFAFYQGGLIQTSRDFCRLRNDKVFHVSEIAKFGTSSDQYGGYTNKSAGEFQGKTAPYDPFLDVGGYNCRHRYFFISNELGLQLRPDLEGVDLQVPDSWRNAA